MGTTDFPPLFLTRRQRRAWRRTWRRMEMPVLAEDWRGKSLGSWTAMRQRQRQRALLDIDNPLGSWGYELARKAIRKMDRHKVRLALRACTQRLRALGIESNGRRRRDHIVPQIPIVEMPIQPMAPCALTFN